VVAFRDHYPVSRGHTLVVPRRHVATYFEATLEERAALWHTVAEVKAQLDAGLHPDGYNVGFNAGEAAGQTVPHLHIHVIPRYRGDMHDPRGGVRGVIPDKRVYAVRDAGSPRYVRGSNVVTAAPHARPLIRGAEVDPLLPHLRAHLCDAAEVDIAVAFVLGRGVALIMDLLEDVLDHAGRVRVVTGDYLGSTEPDALRLLLDLMEAYPARAHVRVYEARSRSFHPKAYIMVARDGRATVLVGSSNLSEMALRRGVEWNHRVTGAEGAGLEAARAAFEELFAHEDTVSLSSKWIDAYQARRAELRPDHRASVAEELEPSVTQPEPNAPAEPTAIQRAALDALDDTRSDGNRAGLVVLATGLGKTWLAAFDSNKPEFARVLFVAHRDDILRQAFRTFRRARPSARLGFFNGTQKDASADVLFASVQTVSRDEHLDAFAPDRFDYIVVDEFHHADARTYRKVIDHFEPLFLLGLTATPERTDGGDLLALCGENLVCTVNLFEGISEGALAPFDYFGVPDEVSYENIPWRRLTEIELTRLVATRARNQNALDQLRKHGGTRILAFCVSISHADDAARFFAEQGYRVVTIHSGPGSAPRAESIGRFEAGELDMIVTVDVFNEGVDIPSVDTVLMLRPTESRVVWLQQLGRGLRRHDAGKRLKVIDYVGNHRVFAQYLELLLSLEDSGPSAIRAAVARLRAAGGKIELPSGCSVTYELEALDKLEAGLGSSRREDSFDAWVRSFVAVHGERPRAVEAYHAGHDPRSLPASRKPFFAGLQRLGVLDARDADIQALPGCGKLLQTVQSTAMERSYKMVLLIAWIAHAGFPGPVFVSDLADAFVRVARRTGPLALDVSANLDDPQAVERLLVKFPIAKWVGPGSGGEGIFDFDSGRLSVRHDAPPALAQTLGDLVRELAEWRLAAYLHRNRQERISRIVDDAGREVDATFTTEAAEVGLAVILESRGGTAGSRTARNTEYAVGLRVVLERLKQLGATLEVAELATRRVSGEAMGLQRFRLPLPFATVASLEELRKDLQAAQGNNPTRRIRLVVSGVEMDLRAFHWRIGRGE